MSQENVEAVRESYAAGNRGDWDLAFSSAAPEFEWETDPRVPNAGIYRGRSAVQRFFEDQAARFEEGTVACERLISDRDRVLAFVRIMVRPRGSSAEVVAEIAHLWTFHDGRCIRGRAFARREDALEAAGLSE